MKTKLTRLLNFRTPEAVNPNPLTIIHESGPDGRRVDLLPGSPELSQLSKQMELELNEPGVPLINCLALDHLIKMYVDVYKYDLVVLDLNAGLTRANACWLWTSDFLLIPVNPDYFCEESFEPIARTIFPTNATETNHGYNRFRSKLRVLGFVPNNVKMRLGVPIRDHQRSIDQLQQDFEKHLGRHFEGLDRFEGAPGTNPCNLMQVGAEIVTDVNRNLLELRMRDRAGRDLLMWQLNKFIRWLNTVL